MMIFKPFAHCTPTGASYVETHKHSHTHTNSTAQIHLNADIQLLGRSPNKTDKCETRVASQISLKRLRGVRRWCEVACLSQNPSPRRIKGARHTLKHRTCLWTEGLSVQNERSSRGSSSDQWKDCMDPESHKEVQE